MLIMASGRSITGLANALEIQICGMSRSLSPRISEGAAMADFFECLGSVDEFAAVGLCAAGGDFVAQFGQAEGF
jgi:hypothetical protein